MKKFTLLIVFFGMFLVGCASGSSEAAGIGNIVSKESVTLSDGATIQVQIQDVSLADAPAKIVGEQSIDGSGEQLPIAYEVAYDPAGIEDRNAYSMSVRIEDAEGNLIYISDTNTPVITRDSPTKDVDINVVPVN